MDRQLCFLLFLWISAVSGQSAKVKLAIGTGGSGAGRNAPLQESQGTPGLLYQSMYPSMGFGFQPGMGAGSSLAPSQPFYGYSDGNTCQGISCGIGRYCEPLANPTFSGTSYRCRRYSQGATGNIYSIGSYPNSYPGSYGGYPGSYSQYPGSYAQYPGSYPQYGIGSTAAVPLLGYPSGSLPGYPSAGNVGYSPTQSTYFGKKVTRCFDELVYKVPVGSPNNDRNRMSLMPGMASCPDQCFRNQDCDSGKICCSNGCGNICYTPETTVIDAANTITGLYGNPGYGGSLPFAYRENLDAARPFSGNTRMAGFPSNETIKLS